MKNTLMLVDDHKMMQNGLKAWIESNSDWKVSFTAESPAQTLEILHDAEESILPEIIIFDVQLGKEQCFDCLKTVTKDFPQIKSLVYSMYDSTSYFLLARESGAYSYVLKSDDEHKLLEALEKIRGGNKFFDKLIEQKLETIEEAVKVLTKQEMKVFHGILKDYTNQIIAKDLGISKRSVEVYISRIYEKLDIYHREELIERYR